MILRGKWRIVELPGYDWEGNDEMDEVSGNGWAELQPDQPTPAK